VGTTIDETTTEELEEIAAEGMEAGFALEQPYEVPSESAFHGKEFIVNPSDLRTVARDLIDACEEFWHLRGAEIEYAWKRKGGMSGGATLYHGHKRSDTHAVAHGAREFLIWIAADIAREQPFTARDVEAAMYHELCHLGWNENAGEVKIVGHPVEYFPSEKRRYGLADPVANDEDDGDVDLLGELAEDADGEEG
jgi:hypothetical protein